MGKDGRIGGNRREKWCNYSLIKITWNKNTFCGKINLIKNIPSLIPLNSYIHPYFFLFILWLRRGLRSSQSWTPWTIISFSPYNSCLQVLAMNKMHSLYEAGQVQAASFSRQSLYYHITRYSCGHCHCQLWLYFLTTATITHQVYLSPKSGWTHTQDDYRTVATPSSRNPSFSQDSEHQSSFWKESVTWKTTTFQNAVKYMHDFKEYHYRIIWVFFYPKDTLMEFRVPL